MHKYSENTSADPNYTALKMVTRLAKSCEAMQAEIASLRQRLYSIEHSTGTHPSFTGPSPALVKNLRDAGIRKSYSSYR